MFNVGRSRGIGGGLSEQQRRIEIQAARASVVKAIESGVQHKTEKCLRTLIALLERGGDYGDRDAEVRYIRRVAMRISELGLAKVGDWDDDALVSLVQSGAFIDSHGDFLFIAPHAPRRSGQRYGQGLTAVCGSCVDVMVSADGLARLRWQGLLKDDPRISFVPFIPTQLAGALHESREYFVPGEMWRFGQQRSTSNPSLLNVEGVRLAAEQLVKNIIGAIFDRASAAVLTTWLHEPEHARRLIALEYLTHEYGHETGVGMEHRSRNGLFTGKRHRRLAGYALDESIADGAWSGFCQQYLHDSDQERDLVAVTLVIRMLDVMRALKRPPSQALFEDVDVLTALRWFEQMVVGGTLFRHRDGRLGLPQRVGCDLSTKSFSPRATTIDLRHVAGPMREWSRTIQSSESCGTDYSSLVSTHSVNDSIVRMFEEWIVRPCRMHVHALQKDAL